MMCGVNVPEKYAQLPLKFLIVFIALNPSVSPKETFSNGKFTDHIHTIRLVVSVSFNHVRNHVRIFLTPFIFMHLL